MDQRYGPICNPVRRALSGVSELTIEGQFADASTTITGASYTKLLTFPVFPPHRLPGSELEPKKVERDDRKFPAPVHILAVDDLRLHRMQHQLAGREAVAKRAPKCPRHPHIERVVQEQVRQKRRDDPPPAASRPFA